MTTFVFCGEGLVPFVATNDINDGSLRLKLLAYDREAEEFRVNRQADSLHQHVITEVLYFLKRPIEGNVSFISLHPQLLPDFPAKRVHPKMARYWALIKSSA